MRRILLFVCTLISLGLSGSEYFYIDDIELGQISSDTTITVDVKAHFDAWVSGWQIDFTLPKGITIAGSSRCTDMDIVHTNQLGEEETYYASLSIGNSGKTVFSVSMERDYDENGNFCGVVKWKPGDYTMFRTKFRITSEFKGGYIVLLTRTACGSDTRPYVTPCLGMPFEASCAITVEGIDIPPLPEYNNGTWLVLCNEEPEYMQIESGKYIVVDLTQGYNQYVPYHFLINGVRYGAVSKDKLTDTEDLLNNPLLTTKYNYLLESNHKYIISITDFGFGDLFVLCILNDADSLDEISDSSEISDVKYFNINGQEISEPRGITIKTIYYKNGSIKVSKIIKSV